MSEAKFTKGPWVAAWGGGARKIIGADGEVLISNEKYYPWNPESGHDWNLIAAAPEMYDYIDGLYQSLALNGGVMELDEDDFHYLGKVIAKARGES